jgi:protein O-mannosyl-transferase
MLRRLISPVSLALGIALSATAVYLLALLFRYVFGAAAVQRHHVESASYLFAVAALVTAFRHTPTIGPAPGADSPGAGSPRAGSPGASPTFIAAFVAAAWVVYGHTVSLGLFSDDFVLAERALAGRWVAGGFLRPVPASVWAIILSATRSPVALHALNITLHGINAALVCMLARRFDFPSGAAAAAGVLFLTFPGSVEAVVWPAAIHDVLATACALGFLLLSQRRGSAVRVIAATTVLILGLLSKESAVAIPLLAVVLLVRLPDPRRTAAWPALVAGALVCLFYVAVRLTSMALPEAYAAAPSRYVVKELIARPIGALAIPWSTAVLDSWPALGFVWALAVVVAAAAYAWRTNKVVTLSTVVRCLIAVFVGVLPVYSMFFITGDLENARYLYLSTAFWVLAVVAFTTTLAASRAGFATAGVLGLAVAAGVAGVQLHLGAWREAAGLRDRVLSAAQAIIERAPCPAVSLAGAPDSVRGAYVFRNGLAEAVTLRTGAVARRRPADCRFIWNGSTFIAAGPETAQVQATLSR